MAGCGEEPNQKQNQNQTQNHAQAQPLFLLCNSSSMAMASSSSSSSHCSVSLLTAINPSSNFSTTFLPSLNHGFQTSAINNRSTSKLSNLSSKTAVSEKWRTRVSFFLSFSKKKDVGTLKEELLQAIAPLDRGADATPEDKKQVDQLARKLEAVNPIKEPLKSELLNGKWELIYTTSKSILQTELGLTLFLWQRPKFLRSKVNYQAINVDTLRAQNMESWPFFNQVTADLTPLNSRKVAVQFDNFKILGLISIKAPGRARGELEITFLDKDLRVSRGNKGNLFILKMIDPSYKVPV